VDQKELFELIFSDALLVDIDLSVWDKRISLYVLADRVGRVAGNLLPMFVVEFSNMRSWNIHFNHLSFDPPIELEPDEHVQWRIRSSKSSMAYRLPLAAAPQIQVPKCLSYTKI